ncbi:cytochrome c-type biogenesis protein [Marinomonas balearica]|uniref:Cytochrome c-type biogenesis protein n=1 Tax=Marinomonas balearica TaxID=491947 RepID=A0A4R6M9X9_9GAMM|nr:cytochrome c-type biogenesis protein [Marinomonas balearica]TDO98327.1 cytochrome c-type biogenesis protein CcmH [Marinomonas balearica]
MALWLRAVFVWFAFLSGINSGMALADSIREFETPSQKVRYEQLIQSLRCPKCQNQSLADSDSAIATDLRDQVYRMITSNKSNTDIEDYMVARYGEFVLYKPVFESHTFFLWAAPLLFLSVGAIVFILVLRAQRKITETEF